MKEQLKDLLPDAKIRRIGWTVSEDELIPKQDQFLLSLKRRRNTEFYEKGTLYVVITSRRVKTKNPSVVKYDLSVIRCPDLLSEVFIYQDKNCVQPYWQGTIQKKQIIPFEWDPRTKKG